MNDAVVAHLVNALRHPVGFDVFTRCEWIDVHAPEAHALRVGPAGFFELNRDIGLHAHDIRDFHRAAKMHDGCRMRAAELRELRQYPTGTQTFGHRTADDTTEIEILIEMSAQRMTGALHLLRALVDAPAFFRQSESVVQPVEQAEFENLLQPLDAAHDGRGTCAQRGCGLAET